MILEALIPCSSCGTKNAVPAIPPFVWWSLLFGVRCYDCGVRFSVREFDARGEGWEAKK